MSLFNMLEYVAYAAPSLVYLYYNNVSWTEFHLDFVSSAEFHLSFLPQQPLIFKLLARALRVAFQAVEKYGLN